MAYSIQYSQQIKRKRKRSHRVTLTLAAMILAMVLRIFAGAYLENARMILFGDGEAAAAFYEVFVKDGTLG